MNSSPVWSLSLSSFSGGWGLHQLKHLEHGYSITIAGDPKRVAGSKRKGFMADMYGFATDGELAAVGNYLRTHGGYEIEQVLYFA